jgi:glyoxylase-like metal-dependent hydrolase (beta-lactamase superfamily II)
MRIHEITPDVACLRFTISNACFAGAPGSTWVLMDAGAPFAAGPIRRAAAARYGAGSRPAAIVLTHGHFDHAGSARALAEAWDVPIYAHRLEAPFLKGARAYPPKDPTVGGAMGFFGRFFPNPVMDLGPRLRELREGVVPGLAGWTWRHTPGHTPGHVCFFHPESAVLIAGDAVITMDLDSPLAMFLPPRVSRPPAPFTYDWGQARRSVEDLARLQPKHIAAGHGLPVSGPEAAQQLGALAADFRQPERGRYSTEAARFDENGVVFLPPPVSDPLPAIAAGAGAAVLAGLVWRASRRKAG